MQAPLRTIVDRPYTGDNPRYYLTELLSCGHTLPRTVGFNEQTTEPSKAKSRRCWKCVE